MSKFKLNKYKLIFGIVYIACFTIYVINSYWKQNFTEYSTIRINYSQFQLEAHSQVKKLFRDNDFYENWKRDEGITADISSIIKIGDFDEKKGYVKNSAVSFDRLRETSNTFKVVIKKTDLDKFKIIVDYLTYCTEFVEKTYIEKYPRINFQVSFPSSFYKKDFRELDFFIIMGLLGSIFSVSVIFYVYEEIKSLKLLN